MSGVLAPGAACASDARLSPAGGLDVERIRQDFPILQQQMHGRPLVYLDNAATAQKPRTVIDTVNRFYTSENANIHRGVHSLSERATAAYEAVREKVAQFINASGPREVVFTRGTTDSINLVAQSYGRTFLKAGDEVLITAMEHHSNIVPWQLLCQQNGATLRAVPLTENGELDLDQFRSLLTERTKFIALVHQSNVLGTINPVRQITQWGRLHAIPVLVDAAQSVAHLPIDVQELGCDFLAFSGHKLFGPTGVGVLYGREAMLERMPPYQGGGGMIETVTLERSTWAPVPAKFEAGTPMIAQVLGLGGAIDYVKSVGIPAIARWEQELLDYATALLSGLPGCRIIGTARNKASVLSFVLGKVHPHDIGTVLDSEGVAIRAGHHCAQPVMRHFGIPATARASFAFYNTRQEIDRLASGLELVIRTFN
jgi:cysteine desulfurase / selenocysteine lyase